MVSQVLIVENDAVFAAVLEDRLMALGHQARTEPDPETALQRAIDDVLDLLVLRIQGPDSAGLDLLDRLRAEPSIGRLPVLVLSETSDSRHRVEALRRGADDFLAMPCDLEELTLRATRLIGSSAERPLEGNLESHHPWELVQYIRNAGKTGRLTIQTEAGKARMVFRQGRAFAAEWQHLPDQEALLAILGLSQGRFRFVDGEAVVQGIQGTPVEAQEALLHSAWIEDELQKRLDCVPATGEPLMATAKPLPPADQRGELAFLPIDAIYGAIAKDGTTRLFDLQRTLPFAPRKLRLTVAWLIEQGLLGARTQRDSFPTTSELTSVAMVDVAVTAYLRAARDAGLGTTALPFLILAEPSVWPRLVELFETLPGLKRRPELMKLVERLRRGKGGSVTLASDSGKLSLNVQVLEETTRSQIEAILTVCASVFVWLDEAQEPELVRTLVERLDRARSAGRGLMVVENPSATTEELRAAIVASRNWQLSTHAPYSLLGILRLAQPSARR